MRSLDNGMTPDVRTRASVADSDGPLAPLSASTPPPTVWPSEPSIVDHEGLSQAEAARRLRDVGYNEIPEESISTLRRFLGNFWGPIPWMLESASVVALLLGAWGTLLIILGNLGLNAIVAFWEEQRASRAIAALRKIN
jgi:H+-transporting ATPase